MLAMLHCMITCMLGRDASFAPKSGVPLKDKTKQLVDEPCDECPKLR